jgi:magnesium-transporting ATPase (P-type)
MNEKSVAPAPIPWHACAIKEVRRRLVSPDEGLISAEAARRLAQVGPNRLPAGKRRGALARLAEQFHNVLIYVLLGAALVAAVLGHAVDTLVIVAVVLVNAAIGYLQEGRAERALDAIRSMISPQAQVMRDGRRLTIDAADIVPGDLVLLEAGDRVPADLRLATARGLRIEEAALTGESVPVDKATEQVAADLPLGDRRSMAFGGTLVVAGQGAGIAVATGAASELGRVSGMLAAIEPLTTPLLRQMDRFARQLTVTILTLSAIVFGFAVLVRSYPWPEAFMAVVGLAVAAIPEGLPAVLTITLAIGVQRMAARRAIIRRLPAVETLGAVSIICSDKTGTLTRNEMTVRAAVIADLHYEVTGAGYEPRGAFRHLGVDIDHAMHPALAALTRASLLCSDAALRHDGERWRVDGDPMEGALVAFAVKAGHGIEATRARYPRLDQIPFDSRHRFMATLNRDEAGGIIYVKGAPEDVIDRCRAELSHGGERPLESERWQDEIEDLARGGLRVLALAQRAVPASMTQIDFRDIDSLVLLGVVGLIDPPREEAITAVCECRAAGIGVKMITGDHGATAGAIGRQLGLLDHETVSVGAALDRLNGRAFRHAVETAAVFARVSPEQKLRIVEALQQGGAVVAMTGDGVNDAPALKRADIGIAMGVKGTEAAKEAAEMVLADDNFATIVAAVREGRTVYDNLTKVIGWTLPTNGGEALAIVTAILFGLALPVTPVQILWINMITAVTLGLALAFEPPEPNVMRRSPRSPAQPLLSGLLVWRIVLVSLLFVAGAFGMFFWASERELGIETARTMAVNAIVAMEVAYLFNVRYLSGPSLTWQGVLGTPAVLIAVGVATAAQLALTYVPAMQKAFETRPLAFADAVAVVAVGAALFAVLELEKGLRAWVGRRRAEN